MTDKQKRGFAVLPPERQREISSLGGRRSHEMGTAYEFTSEDARAAGAKGGAKTSANREHMAAIGRLGGQARGKNLNESKAKPGVSAPEIR
jgi:general stress protein YciG